MSVPSSEQIQWLLDRSMLRSAKVNSRKYAGHGRLWENAYAHTQPRATCALASVWLSTYPASIVTRNGESVLAALGDAEFWRVLSTLGIQALHTGPLKRGGGVSNERYTPSVDGHFDRISSEIDPKFGTEEQFKAMSLVAAAHNAVIIDDIVPGHTGKGPDFRLAELSYGDYPGLYHMIQIRAEDWDLLPLVPSEMDAINLSPATVDILKDKGYIVGQLQRVIFFEPGVKETDWSVTGEITGVDEITRRWVYLHYFKSGQPSLNWLDPTFATHQLVTGDALHSLDVMGARILRLDANGFLGVERRMNESAWSESHPHSLVANQTLAGIIRKAGGFSFQELNLTVDDIAAMSHGGADLSYDFITRPAYHHALVTKDTEFLRMMLRMVHEFGIDPASLIHAMQNHDELTLELVHFWTLHANDTYTFQGKTWPGWVLREHIRDTMYEYLSGEHAPYNLRFVTNGVACTTASVITAAMGIRDLSAISDEQKDLIKRVHLLLAMYNAFQPGVFALSGWDVVGALPVPAEAVAALMTDGDTRWVQRGAYDLADLNPDTSKSADDIVRAPSLYGSLKQQLEEPNSFANQLKRLIAVRKDYCIGESRQIAIPDVIARSLLVMVHELPAGRGKQVTALNFGDERLQEIVALPISGTGAVVDMISESILGDLSETGELSLVLAPYQGLCLRIIEAPRTMTSI